MNYVIQVSLGSNIVKQITMKVGYSVTITTQTVNIIYDAG